MPLDSITHGTQLACEGSMAPLTLDAVVGEERPELAVAARHDLEPVGAGEIRVTILGSGDPFVRTGQASASVLVEVGNEQKDLFFFDLGSGALANFTGLKLPVTSTTKVFLSHLHADHVGDMPAMVWSMAKAGRRDPLEVWGPGSDRPELGTLAYANSLQTAHAWDMQSMNGHPGQSGARIAAREVPYDATEVVYERNGVTVTSFPVLHIQNGSVGYRLDYAGRSVVFSGDTRPCLSLIDAAQGADLLIHETFPSPSVYAGKAGVPLDFAERIVNGVHTSPTMAGKVFDRVGARMSVMWHLAVDHETVGPAYAEMRAEHDGPATIAQDLTTFNITQDSLVTRQAVVDPCAWPVVGPTGVTGPPMNPPNEPPAWWSDLVFTG